MEESELAKRQTVASRCCAPARYRDTTMTKVTN
jgi:hypothetical protein